MSLLKIELENFKKFSKLTLDLGQPITLIYGENSSGKTSAIRALLALMQTFSSQNKYHMWSAHGEYVDLGFYKDYIKDHNIRNRLGISITSINNHTLSTGRKTKTPCIGTMKLCYDFDSETNQARLYSLTEHVYHPKLKESIGEINPGYKVPAFSTEVEAITIIRLKTRSWYNFSLHPLCYLGVYQQWDKLHPNLLQIISKKSKSVHLHQKFTLEATKKQTYDEADNLGRYIFNQSIDQIENTLSSVHYLGPLRMTPFRSYKISNQASNVGINGENTPFALSRLQTLHTKDKTSKRQNQQKFNNFTKWFEMIFPGQSVATEQSEDVVRLKVGNSERIDSIADVGFGFSQVLPILVQAAAMDAGETLIIEQPELHLHPKAQVAFAKFLTAAAKTGVKFIIETHSEHILKGLQLHISNTTVKKSDPKILDSLSLASEDLKIYYFNKDDSFEVMNLNQWGEIDGGWPRGFFDESYNISSQLVRNKVMNFSENASLPKKPEDVK
ncbi:DUF3696 domain-containing protein [Pseudomonas caspiana]|uniref:DUF3696 domain-containing protein n=1 Tax=Pseudomonas caspiana TaxID=1451454 RepID=A0A1Y3P6Q9_9PSED|nr:DUF3696 domain-containing protein [Pseudomonas caspiana]OUM75507.1 hypothetical protein AUC60_04715 [Pseudomonas caspiana]